MDHKTIAVTDANFDQEVLHSPVPVVVDFWAEWCGPCKQLGPTIEELAAEYEGKAVFAKVDVDDNPDTATRYAIRSIPSLMFFHGGELADRLVGVQPKREIAARVDRLLAATGT